MLGFRSRVRESRRPVRGKPHRAIIEVLEDRVLLASFAPTPQSAADGPPTESQDSMPAQIAKQFGQLPLSFEINRGQTDRQVDFLARGIGYTLFLTPREAVFSMEQGSGFEAAGLEGRDQRTEIRTQILDHSLLTTHPSRPLTTHQSLLSG